MLAERQQIPLKKITHQIGKKNFLIDGKNIITPINYFAPFPYRIASGYAVGSSPRTQYRAAGGSDDFARGEIKIVIH